MDVTRPTVAIVGGGIAGLVLGICFERAEIPYCIYERAKEIVPLGSAIYLSPSVAPLLTQLGLFDELTDISKGAGPATRRHEDATAAWRIDHSDVAQRFGYPGMMLARYDLYRILLSKIPAHKVVLRKRLLSIKQSLEDGATLKFADGTSAHCDLVVGADGAYSAVRNCIYQDLKDTGRLPESDSLPLQVTSSCLVGTTRSIDPSLLPSLDDPLSQMDSFMTEFSPYFWVLFTMPQNRVAFMVLKNIKGQEAEDETFRASEWSSKSAVDFANEVRDFKTAYGGKLETLGDLFDLTDPTTMSKVMLEQKLFNTWHHGRVVLIGDAAHKMTPHSGLGAVNAMFDAISLSSLLNDLESNSLEGYTKAFEAYRNERFDIAKAAVNTSRTAEKLASGKGMVIRLVQNVLYKWMPEFLTVRMQNSLFGSKPQITFLPFVEPRGQVESSLKQTQSKRMAPKSSWATAPTTLL